MNQIELFFFFLICFSLILNGVGSESYTSQNPKERIFEKERLETLKDTIEVSGYVTYINPEIDGDYHLRLKTEDTSLLVKRNYTQQDSCLVLEIVCGKGSIFTACNGYKNLIPVPKIGDHIKASGVFVYDKIHRWNEVHPVLTIDYLK